MASLNNSTLRTDNATSPAASSSELPSDSSSGQFTLSWEIGVIVAIIVIVLAIIAAAIFQRRRRQRVIIIDDTENQQRPHYRDHRSSRRHSSSSSTTQKGARGSNELSGLSLSGSESPITKPPLSVSPSHSKRSSRADPPPEHPSQKPPKYYWNNINV
ncbi:hypothetical protein BDP27DRAFT_1331938 [Rhodocollybia butyracea]|uniref:Uncharacterized protein n=1 Tax=Rhodocollybia butyracea TaxID=206335 RepID=A0A9P5U393_9AGAR|nr:hypothetical protein BDP27DRAFT_1331938 [Rhodocollybia butyracea]